MTTPATADQPAARDRGPGAEPTPRVIDDVAQLTPAWLDRAMRRGPDAPATVEVTTEPVGTGQMATTVRARLVAADGTTSSVVVKYARADVDASMAGMAYAKEVSFYTELGGRVAARTPVCHYAAATDDHLGFVLVLEDMEGHVQGDQIAGCPVERAEAALVNLAGLHGPTWCDTDLTEASWLGTPEGVGPDFLAPIIGAAVDAFAARFAAELDDSGRALLDSARELLPGWMLAGGETVAVLHGDYRLDNLLFDPADPASVVAVDWQTASIGPAARDVAFFLATCLSTDDRRRHEDDLLAAYHRALVDHGVTGYDLDVCHADYRVGLLHAPLIVLLGRLTAGVTDRGDEMFLTMWRRSAAAIDDHDTVALVRAAARTGP